MSIDRLSSTSPLLAALREEVARRKEAGGAATTSRQQDAARTAPKRDPDRLRAQLADIVAGVSPDDDAAMDAARKRVVHAVLLWEFGADIREFEEWQPMLDGIVATLSQDAQQRAAFRKLVGDLQKRREISVLTVAKLLP